ncbi:MAG: cyclic nucleotide-binding domain-containing protein, partial [Rhodopila sp.]
MPSLQVPAGATIFRTGDPSQAVFIIEDGEVAITVNGGIEVARLYPGDLFGESGVLEARPRAATATAMTATTLLVTEADTFVRAFSMDNDRALALVKLLCRR